MVTDTRSKPMKNYLHQNDRITRVRTGFEPMSQRGVCVCERERGVAPGLDVEIAGGIVSLLHPSPLDLG